MLKSDVRKQWVDALRSGEYKQGAGLLRRDPSKLSPEPRYCCLGVLCDLAVQAGIVQAKTRNGTTYYGDDRGKSATQLPPTVQAWAGLRTPTGEGLPNGLDLVRVNDAGSMSFNRIAELIESTPSLFHE